MNKIDYRFYGAINKSAKIPEFDSLYSYVLSGFSLTDDDRFKKFNIEISPWYLTLCQWFEDDETDWIYLIQASQTGKTTFPMAALRYISKYSVGPCPVLWVQSTEEESKLFVSDRLRSFLDSGQEDNIKNWKQSYFKVGRATVKVGYGTTVQSLRTKPAKYIFCDECGLYKVPLNYIKKRTRTFEGSRKGIFCTTPPFFDEHSSWLEAIEADFYNWFVECPYCQVSQGMKFSNLRWGGRNQDGSWDYETVKSSTRYYCDYCGKPWENSQKLEIINSGKPVCVDPKNNYKEIEPRNNRSKTLQITGLYSMFTDWGTLAVDFLCSKASGIQSLKVFFTDELAEVPKEMGDGLKENQLSKLVSQNRKSGAPVNPREYGLYTIGIDVQRLGDLYVVAYGWSYGISPGGNLLDWCKLSWHDSRGNPDWSELLDWLESTGYRKLAHSIAIDATDGIVSQQIYDFATSQGSPLVAIRDTALSAKKIEYKQIKSDKNIMFRASSAGKYLLLNSDMVKDEIAIALSREPMTEGSWSFPADISSVFLKQMTNEHRITEVSRSGRARNTWKPKYKNAPQHYFSATVYATAVMDEKRHFLQKGPQDEIKRRERVIFSGVDPWENKNG